MADDTRIIIDGHPSGATEAQLSSMTSARWAVEGDDWYLMISCLAHNDLVGHNRRLWLFSCAVGRQAWPDLPEGFRRSLILGELLGDAVPCPDEVLRRVEAATESYPGLPTDGRLHLAARNLDRLVPGGSGFDRAATLEEHEVALDRAACTNYLRDLVPDPFRPNPPFDPQWLEHDGARAYLLAQEIYYDYRFDRMPELGDALAAAGCADPLILGHCRAGGPHVRGCWVTDGLLRPDLDPLPRLLRRLPVPGDRLVEYLVSDPKDPFTLYRG